MLDLDKLVRDTCKDILLQGTQLLGILGGKGRVEALLSLCQLGEGSEQAHEVRAVGELTLSGPGTDKFRAWLCFFLEEHTEIAS